MKMVANVGWPTLKALNPYVLLAVPSFVLSLILMKTHSARFPLSNVPTSVTRSKPADEGVPAAAADGAAASSGLVDLSKVKQTPADALQHSVLYPSSIGEGAVRPPLVPNPPAEGSVRYLENLRDIQNM